jgi:outer membrane protein assembly factor BamD (BamD/ComL family)
MFKMTSKFCAIFILAVFLISACGTSSVNISHDLSPAELIQRAQEATDRNRYNTALQYYQALYDRNRNNIDLVITSEYETAFIHYKQKKYQQSREEFNAILKYYDSPDAELLPQQFKVLSNIVLKRIEEKENEPSFWSRIPLINKNS